MRDTKRTKSGHTESVELIELAVPVSTDEALLDLAAAIRRAADTEDARAIVSGDSRYSRNAYLLARVAAQVVAAVSGRTEQNELTHADARDQVVRHEGVVYEITQHGSGRLIPRELEGGEGR